MLSRIVATLACVCLFTSAASLSRAQTRARRVGQVPAQTSAETRVEVDESEVVRVETNLVTLPVSITDRDGRYIPDLTKADFRIYEDGVEQEVAYFAAVEKPFTVVLMLDTSSSVWSKLGRIKRAADAFVDQLRADDQVMVVSFASGLTVKCEPTSDRQKIRKAIRDTGRGMSTHLYEAMAAVMTKHLKRIQGRKAIVLFTDGVDARSGSKTTYENTVELAEELDALIYSIRYDTYDRAADMGGPSASGIRLPGILGKLPIMIGGTSSGGGGTGTSRADYARGERYLHDLADVTGGRYYEANRDLRDLDQAFSHIAEELRRQYSLGYYPTRQGRAGERRRISVRVTQPDLAVRARDSYIYQPAPNANTNAQDAKQTPPAPVLKKPLIAAGNH